MCVKLQFCYASASFNADVQIGLGEIWMTGWQHRDINPENLMYSRIGGDIKGILHDHKLYRGPSNTTGSN